MSTTVFPESGDQITEAAWTALNRSLTIGSDYRISGFTLSAGTGLNVNVAAGSCLVQGYSIVSDATQAVSVTASQTNYIWLAEDGTLSSNTTGTNPGDDLLLGTAVTDGSGVTSVSYETNIINGLNVLIRKASDDTVNASTTLTDDSELRFDVDTGSQWEVTALLQVETNSTTPTGVKFEIDCNGGSATAYKFIMGPDDDGAGSNLSMEFTDTAAVSYIIGNTSGNKVPAILRSIVFVSTGGSLRLQFAQIVSHASDVVLGANSFIYARRIC